MTPISDSIKFMNGDDEMQRSTRPICATICVKVTERKVDVTDDLAVHAVFQRGNRLLADLIALNDQPVSIVENEGFIQYSKGLEPRYKLPTEKYMRETATIRYSPVQFNADIEEITTLHVYSQTDTDGVYHISSFQELLKMFNNYNL